MLDSPVPHCQPSTSSSLGIGSPGLSLVKEIKDSTSQHDDDNISTTSGFSSRASDKGSFHVLLIDFFGNMKYFAFFNISHHLSK